MTFSFVRTRAGAKLGIGPRTTLAISSTGQDLRYAKGAIELSGVLADEETWGAALTIVHPLRSLEHLWIPHLTPEDGNVAGDFVFRSPVIVLGGRKLAIAFVLDLDDVARADGFRFWLDYDHPARKLMVCAGAYEKEGHVFFRAEKLVGHGRPVAFRVHVLASDESKDLENPFGMAARFFWRRWGKALSASGESQRAPFANSLDHVTRWAFSGEGWGDEVWQDLELDGRHAGAPVFIVDATRHPRNPPEEKRWREPKSLWNQAWFSNQRCANGLLLHARHSGRTDLMVRAEQMTELALGAPVSDGLFPSVLACPPGGEDWKSARWTNSDRRPPAVSEAAFHLVDGAFTCRHLLVWHRLTNEPRALDRVLAFARRMIALQRPGGAFPGWVEPDGTIARELADSPETAVGLSLLLELRSSVVASRGLSIPGIDGAIDRALAFIESVVTEARWEDFETYYSCAPWGAPDLLGRRVPRNGVFKQNTLSIAWSAEACLLAWRATGDRRHLRLARRCLDELSLYQAVWNPPFLVAPAHGGFGVMNADCEWNDARQSLFAPIYLEAYRDTGDLELFERGQSALLASFSMLYCPENEELARAYRLRFPMFGEESYGFMMENQGHTADASLGDFTIYSWGNGSALATAAVVRERFGQVYLDDKRGRVLGIDGVRIEKMGERFRVEDRFGRSTLEAVTSEGARRVLKLDRGRAWVRP